MKIKDQFQIENRWKLSYTKRNGKPQNVAMVVFGYKNEQQIYYFQECENNPFRESDQEKPYRRIWNTFRKTFELPSSSHPDL